MAFLRSPQSLHFLNLNYNKTPEHNLSNSNSTKNVITHRNSLKINKSFATKKRLFTTSTSKLSRDQASENIFSNKKLSSIRDIFGSAKNNSSISFIRNSSALNLRVLGTGISPETFEYKVPVVPPKLSRMMRRTNNKKLQTIFRVKKGNSDRNNIKCATKVPARLVIHLGLKQDYNQAGEWENNQ